MHIFTYWVYTKPFIGKLQGTIMKNSLVCNHEKYVCTNQQKKYAYIVPYLSSALIDLYLGDIFVVFVGSHQKVYCSKLASPLLYNSE